MIFGSLIDSYYSFRTFNRIASSVAIITVVAVGQTLVVLTRNIDLSVGSIVGFTAYFVGTLIATHNGINPLLAVAIAIALGAALGRRQRRARRLGPGAGGRRDARHAGDLSRRAGRSFRRQDGDHRQPARNGSSICRWSTSRRSAVSTSAPCSCSPCHRHRLPARQRRYLSFARRFYAIGSNPEAAQLIGLPIKGIVFLAFVICGALSGLAGFMFLARFGNITVEAGRGLELSVVAAVVVGGVNIFGGSGTVSARCSARS